MLPGTQQGPALHPLNSFSRKRSQYPSFTGRVYCSVFLSRHRPKKKRKPLVFRLRAASFRALWLSQNAGTHRVRVRGGTDPKASATSTPAFSKGTPRTAMWVHASVFKHVLHRPFCTTNCCCIGKAAWRSPGGRAMPSGEISQ